MIIVNTFHFILMKIDPEHGILFYTLPNPLSDSSSSTLDYNNDADADDDCEEVVIYKMS